MSIMCFTIPGGKLSVYEGHVVQMEYSPIIGGYTMVLSSGKALFMVPPTTKTENNVCYKIPTLKAWPSKCINLLNPHF